MTPLRQKLIPDIFSESASIPQTTHAIPTTISIKSRASTT